MADISGGVTRFTKSGRPSFVQTLARREFERVLTQFRARWDKDYSDADALASASTRLTERDTAVLQPAEVTRHLPQVRRRFTWQTDGKVAT